MYQSPPESLTTFQMHLWKLLGSAKLGTISIIPVGHCSGIEPSPLMKQMLLYGISSTEGPLILMVKDTLQRSLGGLLHYYRRRLSVAEISKVDLLWLKKFVDNYEYVLDAYPELFTEEDIDDIKVVGQLLQEKIDE